MSEPEGFRFKMSEVQPLTIEQTQELIGLMEKSLKELKTMIANDLSPMGAEMILLGIGDKIRYKVAVMTNDQEYLSTYQNHS